ncbi:hypothetical protein [Salicola sp. Rm-C-2C1-2]|uniref:hypothetical protein n=1 Tax=Salicola sp. Rm-C-2C1-2 TaxID=3141321 RepID=UPI0032E4CF6D
MAETITAMRYADLSNTSIGDVVAKIKSGELKGHSRFLNWYVDDVDVEALEQGAEHLGTSKTQTYETPDTTSSDSSGGLHMSKSDPVADSLNVLAWLILLVGALFALYLVNRTPNGVIPAFTTAGAALFQALLLMGFARIIAYLKVIAEK